jgi:hypothetical protein
MTDLTLASGFNVLAFWFAVAVTTLGQVASAWFRFSDVVLDEERIRGPSKEHLLSTLTQSR